jgi:STE24 endopeptidase
MKLTLFCLFATITAFTYWLRHINLQHLKLHGDKVPEGFEGVVDAEKLRTSSAYTFDSSRLGLWDSLFDNALLIIFLFGGLIATYDHLVSSLSTSPIISAVLFFLLLSWVSTLLESRSTCTALPYRSPLRLQHHTPRIWIADFLKSQAIGAVLLAF